MSLSLATGTSQEEPCDAWIPYAPTPGAYVYSVDDPGNAVLTNVEAPLTQPNSIRYSVSRAADVFKSSSVEPVPGQRVDGVNVLVQINEVWAVTDTVSGDITYLPISAHMVLKVPVSSIYAAGHLSGLVGRLVGAASRGSVGAVDLDTGLLPLVHGVTRLPDVSPAVTP